MTVPTIVRWMLMAVAGLLVAVAVAVVASKLTSQRIGLASEPLDAGKALAPQERRTGGRGAHTPSGDAHGGTSTATTTTPPTTASTTVPPPPSVTPTGDDSNSGSDSSGDRSSGDD